VLRDECLSVPWPGAGPDSLRFLVVSDLHCNEFEKLELIKSVFAKLSNETFDAAFVLGDLSENSRMLPELIDTLSKLPNRHGIFLVRGNHDFLKRRQVLIEDLAKRHSIKILSNATESIPELGVELVGLEYPPSYAKLPCKSEGTIRLGLTHTPDNIILFSRLGVDVVVAGHTHGGWVRLPVLGPLLVPSGLGRFLDKGWFRRGRTLMYITSGLPYFAEQKRKPGEILSLTIKPGKEKDGIARIEAPMQLA
jgi:predicted MPP superfamily phosphohydrolase